MPMSKRKYKILSIKTTEGKTRDILNTYKARLWAGDGDKREVKHLLSSGSFWSPQRREKVGRRERKRRSGKGNRKRERDRKGRGPVCPLL